MDNNTSYEEKKARERAWYEQRPLQDGLLRRILRHPVVFSYDRILFNYVFPKRQMAAAVERHLSCTVHRLLIAPCGRGNDFKYIRDLSPHVYGLDLSPIALKSCPKQMSVMVGDILKSPYPDEAFDLIAGPLFFHHLLTYGFVPFLREFHRVLKPGGGIILLEPSIWYPLNLITRPMKRFLGNPYDEVEDEGPFRPDLLLAALREVGFVNIEVQAATFSHCSFYIPLARIVNHLSKVLLRAWPFKYLGWMVVFWAEKPESILVTSSC